MQLEALHQEFINRFGEDQYRTFYAPGRVNLIGEHIDYNGGYVFPCAIGIGTYVDARKRDDDIIKLYSMNFQDIGVIELTLNDLDFNQDHDWANYIKGIIHSLKNEGIELTSGFEAVYYGNIPNGSGLSSSASIEVVTVWMLNILYDLKITRVHTAEIVKTTENKYMGVNTGIMDQFAIANGRKDFAMLLDCATLDVTYVPMAINGYKIVIMNTNKRRELIKSAYNTRRAECDEALKIATNHYNILNLCDLTLEELTTIESFFDNKTIYRRAYHAVSENQRTLKAVDYLKNSDFVSFGKLMNESHESLRVDYEVTGEELDTLVHTAQSIEGVLGARVTGAGYGGCAIALVREDIVDTLVDTVHQKYVEVIGYEPSFYSVDVSDGVKEI